MTGKDREVAEQVCGTTGHNLTAYAVEQVFDASNRAFIPRTELRCSKCTLTAAEIKNLRERSEPQKKKKDPALTGGA